MTIKQAPSTKDGWVVGSRRANRPRALFDDEAAAIARFAKAHGRKWKSVLAQTYWCNARPWGCGEPSDGAILHGLRNDPNWNHVGLQAYKLPKEVKS